MKKIKTALITGASAGIGYELAQVHAQTGGDLVVVARREDKLKDLKAQLEDTYGIQVYPITKDLTQPNAATEVYDDIKSQGIEIDYLINNAGFGGLGKFHQRPLAADIEMINLNIIALTSFTHLVLQDFVQKNSGRILNVSSTASLLPGPLQAVYYATKAFVTSFSNALSGELSNTKVTVTNLMPGATATEFASVSGMEKTALFDKTVSARKVAEDGYKAMLKGKRDIISGLTVIQRLMLSMIPFTPKKIVLAQIKQMQKNKG